MTQSQLSQWYLSIVRRMQDEAREINDGQEGPGDTRLWSIRLGRL